ncbi:MAG: biopolymer transporter ExbD [Kiritimatiellia bacterium]|nr:biopolymer transporter ExbD [Kiritimatiellia bacterium]
MARSRRKSDPPSADLPMTPMIDVVFQLLIYFIVTIKPIDVFAHLDVSRPSPDPTQRKEQPPPVIRLQIYPDAYTINDRPVPDSELDRVLKRLAELDKKQTILISVSALSPHEMLIRVLDLCARNELANLSVVSTN